MLGKTFVMVLLCHSSECGLFLVPSQVRLLGALASLQSTRAQRIRSQEQVQHQNAKSTKYRDQQLAYCAQCELQCDQRPLYTSVLIGDLSPWRHLTACSPCQEVDTTTMHRPLTLDQRRAEFLGLLLYFSLSGFNAKRALCLILGS